MTKPTRQGIKVAIIGGGPSGLSAAIELSRLGFVDWHLYEQKPAISEIGTGITLQNNTWLHLERLGASKHLQSNDFFRPENGRSPQYRDGKSGIVIKETHLPANVPPQRAPCRVHRGRLQKALLQEVDNSRIRTSKKLKNIKFLDNGKVSLEFQDNFTDEVDLVVGADGIRSAVREFTFPGYSTSYAGTTGYRAVVRVRDAEKINGLSKSTVFWFGPNGGWLYTTPLDDTDWVVTGRVKEDDATDRSTWGRDVNVSKFREHFKEYCEPVQQLLSLVKQVKRYDFFSGQRLSSVVSRGAVALIGDAAHPLSGAFGAGAAFALEDSHVLGGALKWASSTGRGLDDALQLLDSVRSPHYARLYRTLDEIAEGVAEVTREATSDEEEFRRRVEVVSQIKHSWMYYHDAAQELENAIRRLDGTRGSSRL
ncbi:salicylate hydroxylase [Fusarium austroafricanum]|uniref:Salicylate hydroxylase n=1 Tax=Fusarium austroafricanum TaxID=2364996 RepID=A0A8H4KFK4_9HYPO|nr:salicylate hydroxylase [Fusarium austroafricanum]